MKVRIINTKENPVIIKSDNKPSFIDKPSWAKSSYLLCPYYLDNTIVHTTSVDDLDKISLYIHNYQYLYMGSL